ncbi:MAG: alpha/beta hydrolase [Candidatus Gracilibacteria bacterium]|jgi:hypothetical protein
MSTFFIIHGVGGTPEENWFPWLKSELEKIGHKVIIPQFPTPENQTLKNWMKIYESYQKDFTEPPILIGHSLGVPFILDILEKYPAKSAYLVSGFVDKADNKFDSGMKTFAQKLFDWPTIKTNCKTFAIFHSDNDPYIKLEKGQEVAKLLDTPLTFIKNAGHFNETSGYTKFPLLLNTILKN